MTPGARVAAAITILDAIIDGRAAEQALTNWARGSRYAGSGDRAAVRDLVFDGLRAKLSLSVRGGAATGRGVMIGLGLRDDWNLAQIFSGEGHAPAQMAADEGIGRKPTDWESADLPAWLWPLWQESLGDGAMAAAQVLQARAPLFLRVNLTRGSREEAQAALLVDAIETAPHDTIPTCLQVLENPRRVKNSTAFTQGLVEVQDAASQAAILRLNLSAGARVLDYCAGGGGKALALADFYRAAVTAHDISTARMRDIPERAARAGLAIAQAETSQLADLPKWDVIVVDAPCSGSGTWRRSPDAKWRINPQDLSGFNDLQFKVLADAAQLAAPTATLVYMTCSVLDAENTKVIQRFVGGNPQWQVDDEMALLPGPQGDGFYLCILKRAS